MRDTQRHLALFDFDGTLIPGDSQLLFFNYVACRHPWRRLLIFIYFLCLPLALLGKKGETLLKRIFLIYLWKMRRTQIEQHADSFVEEVIRPLLYPDVVSALEKHKTHGDLCIMVTASPSVYAISIGRSLGFELTLGTDVEYEDIFPLLPKLTHGNNKGKTKVVRLRKMNVIPAEGIAPNSSSYSDSTADLPMLNATGERILINPSEKLLSHIRSNRLIINQQQPWRNSLGLITFCIRKIFFF